MRSRGNMILRGERGVGVGVRRGSGEIMTIGEAMGADMMIEIGIGIGIEIGIEIGTGMMAAEIGELTVAMTSIGGDELVELKVK